MKALITVTLLFITSTIFGQNIENASDLKLADIMKGNAFIGYQPEDIRWSLDGKKIIFEWNPNNEVGSSTYAYNTSTKTIDSLTPNFYTDNASFYGDQKYDIEFFTRNGVLYQYDRKTRAVQLVFSTADPIGNVQRSEQLHKIYFQTGTNLYSYDQNSHAIKQLIRFKKGERPSDEKKLNHWEQEELDLFQYHKDQKEKNKWKDQQDELWNDQLRTIYYKQASVSNIQISKDERYITFRVNAIPDVRSTHVEHHISSDGHSTISKARAKVSENDPNHKLGIYDLKRDSVYYADFSTLSEVRTKPAYYKIYGDDETHFDKDRNIIMHRLKFSDDGLQNVLDVRSHDNKDRWIISVDLASGQIQELEHQHDEAWIGGPGISGWNMSEGTLGWLRDNKTFFFQSEESGYSHLYSFNIDTQKKNTLTSGNWEIHSAELNAKGDILFVTANKTHPGNRGFYHLKLKDNTLLPILTSDGNYEVEVSPDENYLAIRYSTKTQPWKLFIAQNKSGA
ncbi:MAG: DPP IV N-terminal domain-containing protein, partial [Crocinitomicaceae bacterium]|nr:DPP IV N-terminal domain-containing protein [Crocinitomicaceae bacterium]